MLIPRAAFVLQDRFDHGAKTAVELFGRHLSASLDPPQYHFHEASCNVVDEKLLRHVGNVLAVRGDVEKHEILQAVLEVAQENVAARGGQQAEDIAVVFFEML